MQGYTGGSVLYFLILSLFLCVGGEAEHAHLYTHHTFRLLTGIEAAECAKSWDCGASHIPYLREDDPIDG